IPYSCVIALTQSNFHSILSCQTMQFAIWGDIDAVAFVVLGPPRTRRAQNGQTAVRARRRLLSRPSRSLCRGHEISGAAGGFGPTARGSAGLTLLACALAHRLLPDHPTKVPPNSDANSSAIARRAKHHCR